MAWSVRRGSVQGKDTETIMSIVYPGSLKFICGPGAKVLVGQGQEDICDDVSTDLPV